MSKMIDRLIRSVKVRVANSNNMLRLSSVARISKKAEIVGSIFMGNVIVADHAAVRYSYLHGEIKIAEYTSLNGPNIDIYAQHHPVSIGKFCSIARNVSIQSHNHNFKRLSTYFVNKNLFGGKEVEDITSKGKIEISNDVWIGTHSVILSGVKIGNGAIIGANSVVSRDIPDYAIAVGSPAKVIGYRFERETIEILLKSKWWDWPISKIKANKKLFQSESESEMISFFDEKD